MVKRAGKGASYFLLARLYKLVTRNHLVKYDKTQSRFHHHTGRPNDFTSHPPLIFGVRCNVLIEREKRDGIGAQRYEECEVVGMTLENKYVLRKLDTGRRIVRRTVDPIDELELAQRGLPSIVEVEDAEVQTDVADFVSSVPPAPPLKIVAGYEPLPDGTKLEVGFKDATGAIVFYPGVVKASHPQTDGRVLTEFTWDDPAWADDPQWKGRLFDLASQHHPWRVPKVPIAAKPVVEPNRRSMRLAQHSGATAAVTELIEAFPAHMHVELFHDAVYQHHGEMLEVACSSLHQLDAARTALHVAEASLIELRRVGEPEVSVLESLPGTCEHVLAGAASMLEVAKATQLSTVRVNTPDGGSYVIHVPRNKKEHAASPQRDRWDVAFELAHRALVDDPRNSMVRQRDVKAAGGVIAPCVREDRIKLGRDNGYLDKFKSRLCYDQARVNRVRLKIGKEEHHRLYSTDADDISLKLFLGDAVLGTPEHGPDDMTDADLKNAYWHADRYHTPYCWMDTYEPMYDEEGFLLCYQCGAPMNGEETAGSDFHIWRDGVFEGAGAMQSLLALGIYTMRGDDDDHRMSVVTCVDDFLIRETAGYNKALTMRVLAAFATAMGGWDKVTYGDRPTKFKGYGIAWARDNSVVTIHMTSHIEGLAHKYVPELFDGVVPPDILTGSKLCQAADKLVLVLPRPDALCRDGKMVQEIGGGAKYIERGVMPRVSLLMHRVSCCSSSPPLPLALTVCRSIVNVMYQNRYEGITFGGARLSTRVLLLGGMYCDLDIEKGAPAELEAMADSTNGLTPICAVAICYNGGLVAHAVKKLEGVIPNSCIAEMKGSTRASEHVEVARNVLTVFGRPQPEPTVLGTDNSANLSIAMGTATPARVKPDLIKWASLKDRIRRKLVFMTKVATAVMPVDFMTKWIKRERMREQLAYLINSRHAVWPA